MAQFISIKNDFLTVKIAPNNGGMVAQIFVYDKDVLLFNEGTAETTPMSAGGVPVLFPFPSRTKDDAYRIEGREYAMPMHGLVKNASFATKSITEHSVVLWCDGSSAQKQANYPFDYALEIEYSIAANSLISTARITNRSNTPMPHYLGWHPYFKATDKAKLKFEHSMQHHYDYFACKDEPTILDIDLSRRWDDVFHTPTSNEFSLVNEPDGYKATYVLDEAHQVVVVCSWIEGAVCLEPWCGLPDSINNRRFVKWIEPGMTKSYSVELRLEKI